MVLSHPNKEFGFGPSNPNPWAQIHPIQTDQYFSGLMVGTVNTNQYVVLIAVDCSIAPYFNLWWKAWARNLSSETITTKSLFIKKRREKLNETNYFSLTRTSMWFQLYRSLGLFTLIQVRMKSILRTTIHLLDSIFRWIISKLAK